MSRPKKDSPVVAVSRQATIAIEPVCLDIPQAATFMATSTHAVRQLIRLRKLKAFQLGKKLVLPVADLRAYVAAQAAA
jgi:hypothetical protein